jgi:hypothetical protein
VRRQGRAGQGTTDRRKVAAIDPPTAPTSRTQHSTARARPLKIPRHARPTTRVPVPVPRSPVWCRSGSSAPVPPLNPAPPPPLARPVEGEVQIRPSGRGVVGLFFSSACKVQVLDPSFLSWTDNAFPLFELRKACLAIGQIQRLLLLSFHSFPCIFVRCLRSMV